MNTYCFIIVYHDRRVVRKRYYVSPTVAEAFFKAVSLWSDVHSVGYHKE